MTPDIIKKIAKLARLRLSEKEVQEYTGELSGIFKWIEQLQQVNTDGVQPMAGVGMMGVDSATLRLREDKITDGNNPDAVLTNAPHAAYGCYLVPKVVE